MRLNSHIFTSFNLKSIFWGMLILCAVGAFVFTGFGSLRFSSLWGMSDNTAAQVGQQEISLTEFAHDWGNGQPGTPAETQMRQRQLLESLINQKILVDVALESGFQVSEEEIVEFLKKVPNFRDTQTNTFSYALFQNFLASQRINQQDFYGNIKNQLLIQKLQNIFEIPVPLAPAELQKLYTLAHTDFHLEYAVLEPSAEALAVHQHKRAQAFLADPKNQPLLKQRYEAKKHALSTPESFDTLTLLISYEEAQRSLATRTKEEALKLAKEIQEKLKQKPSDWPYFSSQFNDDLGAKSQEGSRMAVTSESIEEVSWQTLQALTTEHPLSEVLETPFGYRIWQIKGHRPAKEPTFPEVKEQLAQDWAQEELNGESSQKIAQEAQGALAKKSDLAPLFQEYALSWKKLEKPYRTNMTFLPPLGDVSNLASEVEKLQTAGQMVDHVLSVGGKPMLVKLVSRQAPHGTVAPDKLKSFETSQVQQANQKAFLEAFHHWQQEYQQQGKIRINPQLFPSL